MGLVRWRWPWELAGAGQEERSNGSVFREADRSLVGVFGGGGLVEGLQQVGLEGPVGLIGVDGGGGNFLQGLEAGGGAVGFGDRRSLTHPRP